MTKDAITQTADVISSTPEGAPASKNDLFLARLLVVLSLTTLFTLAVLLIIFASDIFLLIFAGILLAVFLRAGARVVHRWTSISETWSLMIVVAVLAIALALATWMMSATVLTQLSELWSKVEGQSSEWQKAIRRYPLGERLLKSSQTGVASGQIDLMGHVADAFSLALGAVGNLLVIAFIGIYLALDPHLYRRVLLHIVPKRHRRESETILDSIDTKLTRWLVGRLFGMFVIGVGTGLGLWILGVPLVLGLGTIAFVFEFIPYFGPIISGIPAVIVALSVSPQLAVYTVLLYVAIQSLESYILTPLIERKAVFLPPAVILIVQILLGSLVGVLGLALATPLTAVLVTVFEEIDKTGDDDESVPA